MVAVVDEVEEVGAMDEVEVGVVDKVEEVGVVDAVRGLLAEDKQGVQDRVVHFLLGDGKRHITMTVLSLHLQFFKDSACTLTCNIQDD